MKPTEKEEPRKLKFSTIAVTEELKNYCENTSLHGFQYLLKTGTVWGIIWLATILCAFGLGIYLSFQTMQEYMADPPITNINDTTASLRDVVFPSLTICNVNQIQRSVLDASGFLDIKNKYRDHLIQQYLEASERGEPLSPKENLTFESKLAGLERIYNWTSDQPFGPIAAQKCGDLVLKVQWRLANGTSMAYLRYNATQSHTDYGVCCSIFPQLDFENPDTRDVDTSDYTGKDFMDIKAGVRSGDINGLKVILDLEGYEYAYYPRGAKGVTVALADPRDRPVIRQRGFLISPGTENRVLMKITKFITDTDITEGFWAFPPSRRICYTDKDFVPQYYNADTGFRYEISNCMYDAMVTKIINTCNCRPPFATFTRSDNKLVLELMTKYPVCVKESLFCLKNFTNHWGNENRDLDKTLNTLTGKVSECYQACNYQSEQLFTSSSQYPSKNTFPERKNSFCQIVKKVRDEVCKNRFRRRSFEDHYGANECAKYEFQNICTENYEFEIENLDKELQDSVIHYARDNVISFKIFVGDPYYTQIVRSRKISMPQMLGTIGGLIGLCIGFSVVSLVEVFYFVTTMCSTCSCKKKSHS